MADSLDERLRKRSREVFGHARGADEMIALMRGLIAHHDSKPEAEWLACHGDVSSWINYSDPSDPWRYVSLTFCMPSPAVDKAIGFVDVRPSPLDLEQQARFAELELGPPPVAAAPAAPTTSTVDTSAWPDDGSIPF